jgi:xylulokinase
VILAIDIGTSNFKAALFGFNGECRAFVSQPLAAGMAGGRHEIDPRLWLAAFESCCLRLDSMAGPLAGVEALSVSGNGPTLVPAMENADRAFDHADAAALGPARLWLDRRAGEEARAVSEAAGAFVDGGFFLPKALYIKNREPELYEKTGFFFYCPEVLAWVLTGEARTVFPSEGFERWYWTAEMLDRLGLDSGMFPPFISPGQTIGTLLPSLAGRFGFRKAVPVIAGGPDFFTAILGSGAVRPGMVCDRSGTSEGINLCTEKRIMDRRLMSYGHPAKPYWNLSGIISTTGKAIEWARTLLGFRDYDDFYAAAAGTEADGVIFLPYLEGERAPLWDAEARGVFFGMSSSTTRAALARAAAEGICFAVRDVISVMEEAEAPAGVLRVTGGTSRSSVLNQIKADVTERDVIPVEGKAELTGLAVLAASALGKYGDRGEAAFALVKSGTVFHPDEKKARLYEKKFGRYRSLYRSLREEFRA